MKIERLSENQIRLTLTRSDLQARDIKLEDLMQHSSKTQGLFREIMENTLEEYEFIGDNASLMIEASPSGHDSIIIVVTRITAKEDGNITIDDSLFSSHKSQSNNNWRDETFEDDDFESDINLQLLVYSFEELDHIINFAIRVANNYNGKSSIYKVENQYFLLLDKEAYKGFSTEENLLPYIIQEYGEKYISNTHSNSYLLERGEVIIKSNAINILADTFKQKASKESLVDIF